MAGGVAANAGLRNNLQILAQKRGWQVSIPAFEYCTDNAGMVAIAAHYKFEAGLFAGQESAPYV